MQPMEIIKASGKKEEFREGKLRFSLERAGVDQSTVDEIVGKVTKILRPGITSKNLLNIVLSLLTRENPAIAARYNLKGAMMNLGPSGYPFERYFARIMEEHGYRTKVGEMVKGYCTNQEIDIIATKGEKRLMVECKHHNSSGARSDLKVALYTYARFLDVKEAGERDGGVQFNQAVLATNTKCTSEAIKFAECRGIKVIAWYYPKKGNLQDMIEKKNLYPITTLLSLSNYDKKRLLRNNIILAGDLIDVDIDKLSLESGVAIKELRALCQEAGRLFNK